MLTFDAKMSAVRTTIRIDEALYRRAKAHAARTGRTVSEVIEDAVRQSLRQRRDPAEPRPLPVADGSGLLPGVDLADGRALRDRMDADLPVDAMH
jgi:hypothetical protein